MRGSIVIAFLLGIGTLAAVAKQPSSASPHTPSANKEQKPDPSTAPAPEPAAVPPVLPSSVAVSYQNGLLTITAQNVTLREIMDRVRESTGAWVEVPALSERVTVSLGPQPPAAAIAALLEGAHLNYVILGGAEPGSIAAIQVTPEPTGAAPPAPPRSRDAEMAAAMAQARLIAETGGDEGVWDNVEVGVPTAAAQAPTAAPTVPSNKARR